MRTEQPTQSGTGADLLLRLRGIHKHFPGVHVLKGIEFEVCSGEVHALVGENGAGKSTLMHILAGVHQPDAGSIEWCGDHDVVIENEHAAQRLGLAIVFQERSLFGTLNVAENVFAGRQPINRWGRIDRGVLRRETRRLLDQVGLTCDPDSPLTQLSPAQQQMVEIAKALSLHARLIIFDEPTAALTETETRALFAVIRQLKAQQVGIIYISHRLEEVFQMADRVTVLKDGEGQGTFRVSETTPASLINRMVGRDLAGREIRSESDPTPKQARLEVRDISDALSAGAAPVVLRGISFEVRAGEILVLAGLAGSGRTELAMSIFGARPKGSGEVLIDGQPVRIHSPADAIAFGLGYLPEDRKEAGLFLEMSVAENVAAAQLRLFGDWWHQIRRQEKVAEQYRQKLRIACRTVRQSVQRLSGGNQQKVVLSRWLLANPRVLIVDEPTRGIDVGAKAEVHSLLVELARNGTAVVVISSELPEVLALADRVLVLRQGRIAGELTRAEATEEKIMRYASLENIA